MKPSLQVAATQHHHGHARRNRRSQEYQAWVNMLARCRPGRPDADRYYSRGVRVCDRWNPEAGGSFDNFLADMGCKPDSSYSLDKDGVVPGNLLYCPEACRWASPSEQMTARRNTHWLTYKGETLSLQQWADKLGIKRSTLLRRIKLGWATEDVLNVPPRLTNGRFKAKSCVAYNGFSLSIAEWSKRTGIPKATIAWRLRNGWPPERALTSATRI